MAGRRSRRLARKAGETVAVRAELLQPQAACLRTLQQRMACVRLAPNRFKELLPSVKDSKEPVATITGCIMENRTFGAVAKEIEAGRYDPWIEPHK